MRRSSRLFWFLCLPIAPLTAFIIAACGSDYGLNPANQTDAASADGASSDGGAPAQGTKGGDCYPNGTCNQGLQCIEGKCLSGPAIDAGNNQKDAAPIVCPTITNKGDGCFFSGGGPPAGLECIDPTGGAYNQTCSNIDAGCPTGKRINCLSPGDCAANGPACCFNVEQVNDTACTTTVSIVNTIVSVCQKSCAGANSYQGCRNDADCLDGYRCKSVSSNLPDDAGDSIFAICVP